MLVSRSKMVVAGRCSRKIPGCQHLSCRRHFFNSGGEGGGPRTGTGAQKDALKPGAITVAVQRSPVSI